VQIESAGRDSGESEKCWNRLSGWKRGSVMTVATRTGISDNAAGAVSYFTFIPAIAFLLLPPYKESSYVRFHAWQSVLLCITAFVVDIVLGAIALLTLFLGTLALAYTLRMISLLWLILWLVCVVQAMNGKRFKIPVLGSIAEKLAMK
jgi:uncharacterized membrane protein